MRVPVLIVLLAAMASGCAEDGDEPAAAFSAADAQRLARIAPGGPSWDWPTEPTETGVSDPDDEPPTTEDDPDLAALYDELRDLEGLGGASTKWSDDDKLAHLNVSTLATTSDARRATAAYRKFLHAWGEDFGTVTEDEAVDGLGDDAWVIAIDGNGTQVSYEWRVENLVLDAHVHCYGTCPADVDGAARAWAEAVQAEVRRT